MSTNIVHPNISQEILTFESLLPNIPEKTRACIARVESAVLLRNTIKVTKRNIQASTPELVDAVVEASSHGVEADRVLVLQTPKQGLARKACTAFFAGIPESVCDDFGNLPPNCLFPLGIVAVRGTHLDEIQVGCPESGWFNQEAIHTALINRKVQIGFSEVRTGDPSEFLNIPTTTIVTPAAQSLLATMRENPTE